MGIFSRKLNYEAGKGVIPKVSVDRYSDLVLPDTYVFLIGDLNLMKEEKDAGKLESAFGASVEAGLAEKNFQYVNTVVSKYASTYLSKMQVNLNKEALDFITKSIAIGCGMNIVEKESGLLIDGKVHPSIFNVIKRFQTNLTPEVTAIFTGINHPDLLIEKAVEIGYVASRLNLEITPEKLMEKIRPIK